MTYGRRCLGLVSNETPLGADDHDVWDTILPGSTPTEEVINRADTLDHYVSRSPCRILCFPRFTVQMM